MTASSCSASVTGNLYTLSPLLPWAETDGALRRDHRRHQLADCIENGLELRIVFPLERRQLARQLFVRGQHRAQADKGAHDLNVHQHGPLTAQNARKHGDTLLAEGVRTVSPAAPS